MLERQPSIPKKPPRCSRLLRAC